MATNGGLQLLPEVRRSIEVKRPGENRHLIFASFIFGLTLGLTASFIIYVGSLRNEIISLDVAISNLENERDKKAEEKVLQVKDQLRISAGLLNNHLGWSRGLAKIQNKTSSAIKYQNFDADLDGFVFKALAPNYSAVAKQIAAYASEEAVNDIELGQLKSLTVGQVEFIATIYFDKGKFLLNKKPQ